MLPCSSTGNGQRALLGRGAGNLPVLGTVGSSAPTGTLLCCKKSLAGASNHELEQEDGVVVSQHLFLPDPPLVCSPQKHCG